MKNGHNSGEELTADRDSKGGDEILRRMLKTPPKKHVRLKRAVEENSDKKKRRKPDA